MVPKKTRTGSYQLMVVPGFGYCLQMMAFNWLHVCATLHARRLRAQGSFIVVEITH